MFCLGWSWNIEVLEYPLLARLDSQTQVETSFLMNWRQSWTSDKWGWGFLPVIFGVVSDTSIELVCKVWIDESLPRTINVCPRHWWGYIKYRQHSETAWTMKAARTERRSSSERYSRMAWRNCQPTLHRMVAISEHSRTHACISNRERFYSQVEAGLHVQYPEWLITRMSVAVVDRSNLSL